MVSLLDSVFTYSGRRFARPVSPAKMMASPTPGDSDAGAGVSVGDDTGIPTNAVFFNTSDPSFSSVGFQLIGRSRSN